jgi:hypothetical protein
MRAALCFLLGRGHGLIHEACWIDWIAPNADWIDVYVHSPPTSRDSEWVRAHRLPPAYLHPTSYWHVMPACLSLMGYAVTQDARTQWACLLTESCVPLVSPAAFRARFQEDHGRSLIRCQPAYWPVQFHTRAHLRDQPIAWQLANDPWFTLTRVHVEQCLHWVVADPAWVRHIWSGGLANESYVAMALARSGEYPVSPRVIPVSSTVADWSRMASATSPYTFRHATPDNLACLCAWATNPYRLFWRKADASFPVSRFQWIPPPPPPTRASQDPPRKKDPAEPYDD